LSISILHAALPGSVVVLRIVPYPHPALRYASRPVLQIDDKLRGIVREMFDLMYASNGVGIPLRFFILNLTADAARPDQEQVFINPEIVKKHSSEENEEGCLSFPGLYGKVRRARKIRVQAYDLAGNPVELDAEELLGRAIQHETDHLDGKLFIDYLGPIAKTSANTKVKEIEAGYRKAQAEGIYPDDDEIRRQLDEMAKANGV
jgi:peptide deformylase